MIRHEKIQDRIADLIRIEELYSSLFYHGPTPTWHKTYIPKHDAFHMDEVNASYTEATGIAQRSYEGQADSKLWEKETAEEYYKNDKYVVNHRAVIPIEEFALNPKSGKPQVWVGFKWPHIVNRKVIGVWGMADSYDAVDWVEIKKIHPFWLTYGDQIEKIRGEHE